MAPKERFDDHRPGPHRRRRRRLLRLLEPLFPAGGPAAALLELRRLGRRGRGRRRRGHSCGGRLGAVRRLPFRSHEPQADHRRGDEPAGRPDADAGPVAQPRRDPVLAPGPGAHGPRRIHPDRRLCERDLEPRRGRRHHGALHCGLRARRISRPVPPGDPRRLASAGAAASRSSRRSPSAPRPSSRCGSRPRPPIRLR